MTAEVGESLVVWDMLDGNGISSSRCDGKWDGRGSLNYHVRGTRWLEIKVHDIVLTLWEFQLLIGSFNDVMPKLTVLAGTSKEISEMGHGVIRAGPWQVGAVVDIINKPKLKDGRRDGTIRRVVLSWSVGFGGINIIESAGEDKTVGWRVASTLACAKPGAFKGVADVLLRDAIAGSEVIAGLLEGFSLDHTSLGGLAILATGHIHQEAGESIVTGCGVVIKMDKWKPSHADYFILHLANEHRVKRGFSWDRSIACLVE